MTDNTVSACKEGHKKDCDMLSNVGIPSAQKDESYCTCGKSNSPTETVSDYKNKEASMSKTTTLDPKKGWIPAIEERYYPSLFERVKHFIGIHCWTITPHPRECVICGKIEKRWVIFSKTSGGSTNNGNGYSHKTVSLSIFTRLGSGDDGTRSNL